jgi:hypothetical protein
LGRILASSWINGKSPVPPENSGSNESPFCPSSLQGNAIIPMNFGNLTDKLAKGITSNDKLASLLDEKINGLLGEYSQAVATLQTLGLNVGKIRVEMGLLPQVSTTIRGSVNDLDPEKIQKLLDSNSDKKLLSSILSALLTLVRIREVVDLKDSKNVVLDVTLGVPPKVSAQLE